jgi:hypothetical protein|tara:strand:- start:307 stop:471 length:165 start_codon:yes stop_codon:yes gene_type:complete
MELDEYLVTILSFEEFEELLVTVGTDEITTMELIQAVAKINGDYTYQTEAYGYS